MKNVVPASTRFSFKNFCSDPLWTLALLLVAQVGVAQPVWQTSETNVGTGNTVTVSKPSGVTAGDLLVAGVMFEKGTGVSALSAPAGWALLLRTNESGDVGMQTYYRVADGTEGATFSFTLNNTPKWAAGVSRISGASIATPINVLNGANGGGNSSTNVVAPSVTTTVDNVLVLAFYTNKSSGLYSPAGGTTERYDSPNTSGSLPSNMLATYVQTTAGATGTKTATTNNEKWAAQQIAINPAPSNTQTFTTSDVFTVPAGVTSITVHAWGGGGGGKTTGTRGGGGGGGAYATKTFAVTPLTNYTVTIGAGGSAEGNGGSSSFGSEVIAVGGIGATGNNGAAGGSAASCTPMTGAFSGGGRR